MGISFLIPIFLLLVDLTIVFAAIQANDFTCRNVARSAAAGPPEDADNRALAILSQRSQTPEGWLSNIILAEPVVFEITKKPTRYSEPDSSVQYDPGWPIEGSAIASTQIRIKPIFVHVFSGKRELTFKSLQSCPISYIVPASGKRTEVEE